MHLEINGLVALLEDLGADGEAVLGPALAAASGAPPRLDLRGGADTGVHGV